MTPCILPAGCPCADGCPQGCYLDELEEEPLYGNDLRGDNHRMTEDERLDDPRHGQAEELNRTRYRPL